MPFVFRENMVILLPKDHGFFFLIMFFKIWTAWASKKYTTIILKCTFNKIQHILCLA